MLMGCSAHETDSAHTFHGNPSGSFGDEMPRRADTLYISSQNINAQQHFNHRGVADSKLKTNTFIIQNAYFTFQSIANWNDSVFHPNNNISYLPNVHTD
jgi:hypothetical protein